MSRTWACCSSISSVASMTVKPNSSTSWSYSASAWDWKIKALGEVGAETHIHAGFVIFQFGPRAAQQTGNRHLDRHAKVKHQIGPHREAVEIAQPAWRHASHRIAREGRVHVPVGQHYHARLQRREDLMVQAIGEISRVQQAESERSEDLRFFPAPGGFLDEFRR